MTGEDAVERSSKSKPYMEGKKKAEALRIEGIPKGLMGYTAVGKPAFSTREIASLWLLQRMIQRPDGPHGSGWHGRALVREIREATKLTIPGTGEVYEGYNISDGVCFGLLREWLDAGIVEVADKQKAGYGKMQISYKVTEKGKQFYQQLRKDMRVYVAGASLLMNRLHADVYGFDVWAAPARADELSYLEALDVPMPRPQNEQS